MSKLAIAKSPKKRFNFESGISENYLHFTVFLPILCYFTLCY